MPYKENLYPQEIVQTVVINATPAKVWDVLTNITLMKQWLFEGEIDIITDWKTGSPIFIKANIHDTHFENEGVVLQFEPELLLTYTHLSSLSDLPYQTENYTIISFELIPKGEQTSLTLTLRNFPTETIYHHFAFYWGATIEVLKQFIEQLD